LLKNGIEVDSSDGFGKGFLNWGKSETTWKDGEKDGLETQWYRRNGKKESEITWKNGERDGLATWWYENGQKMGEQTLKNGERDGFATKWYENGQKKEEGTYKNGKLISSKCWDEDGDEKECN
jgi:antitoxin component YwqK of YwqJK toxin-antitoxin module